MLENVATTAISIRFKVACSLWTGPIRIDALTRPTARSGDCNALDLNLPGWVGETADDERARRPMFAQH